MVITILLTNIEEVIVKEVIAKLFSKKLSSILSGFEKHVADLDTFIEQNHKKLTELQSKAELVRSEHARAERVASKLKSLLS